MNELTPTDIALLNRINDLTLRIGRAQPNTFNFASIYFSGRIGASSGGHINFGIRDKMECGELEFRGLEHCCEQLERVYSWASAGRMP